MSYGGGGNYGNYGNASYGGGGGGGGDYSTTSYGGQGGAGGGGFMSGSQPQGSQGGGSKYGKESLRSVTILQCMSAPDSIADNEIKIDGVEVGHIQLVGQIRNIAKQTTNTTYVLDDGTGTVDAKVWVDPEKQTTDDAGNELPRPDSEQGLEIGRWVRCFGKLKQFNGKKHVGVLAIRAIKDMNEINHHLLEAAATHLYFTRGPPGGDANGAVKDEDGLFVQQGNGGGQSLNGLNPTARAIVEFLKSAPANNEGYNAQHIAATLRMPVADVTREGMSLLDQSILYPTTDDSTWALLSG